MKKMRAFSGYVKNRLKSIPFTVVMTVYALFCLISFIYFCVLGQVRNLLESLFFLLFVPLVFVIEKGMRLRCPAPFLAVVLFICAGSILGACYDFYTLIPFFDTILHTLSGFIFACLGFALIELLIGEAKDKKSFFGCMLFGLFFSLAIGLVWELFEYLGTVAMGYDMQEDTIINSFNSYLLSGTHAKTFDVDGIVQTVIYLKDGSTVTIDGYLDIGLIDTIEDMSVCFFGSLAYFAAISISWFTKRHVFNWFVPAVASKLENSNAEYVFAPAPNADVKL